LNDEISNRFLHCAPIRIDAINFAMEYDNPAERLLTLIRTCKEYPIEQSCLNTWHKVLKTENNLPLLMSRLGKVMELPQITVQALQDNFPGRTPTWRHWSTQINNAFMQQNFQSQWNSFIGHIDEHSVNYLQMSSDLLQSKSTTTLLENSELDAIRKQLLDIYEQTLVAEIDTEVKAYLLRYFRKLISCIEEYTLIGALPILEAIESMCGHTLVDKKYKSFLTDEELGRKILDCISSMGNLITVAVGIPQLAHGILQLAA